MLTSLVELSTKGPPNMAAIQSQLEMSRGLWALIAPSSSTKVTSRDKQRGAAGTLSPGAQPQNTSQQREGDRAWHILSFSTKYLIFIQHPLPAQRSLSLFQGVFPDHNTSGSKGKNFNK